MKKILFSLMLLSIFFTGCSWNNHPVKSNPVNMAENEIGDSLAANYETNPNESVQKQILYPANNFIGGKSFLAESDRYIAYTNHDEPLLGVYLYNKDQKSTVKIRDNYAGNLVVGINALYFDDGGRLKKIDFSGQNEKEIVDHLITFTACDQKIYYSSNDANLYELDMDTDSIKLIAEGNKVFTETDMSKQYQNLCLGDRIYFSTNIDKNGERITVLMGINSAGSVSRIHECISLVDMAVYDRGYLYFADKNGLARIKADSSGLEERLVSNTTDGEYCDNFYVYDGKWYYQKHAKDRSPLFCMGSEEDQEQILLDLDSPEFGQICRINQTADFIFLLMTDPAVKANHYNYIEWVFDKRDKSNWRLAENFR